MLSDKYDEVSTFPKKQFTPQIKATIAYLYSLVSSPMNNFNCDTDTILSTRQIPIATLIWFHHYLVLVFCIAASAATMIILIIQHDFIHNVTIAFHRAFVDFLLKNILTFFTCTNCINNADVIVAIILILKTVWRCTFVHFFWILNFKVFIQSISVKMTTFNLFDVSWINVFNVTT